MFAGTSARSVGSATAFTLPQPDLPAGPPPTCSQQQNQTSNTTSLLRTWSVQFWYLNVWIWSQMRPLNASISWCSLGFSLVAFLQTQVIICRIYKRITQTRQKEHILIMLFLSLSHTLAQLTGEALQCLLQIICHHSNIEFNLAEDGAGYKANTLCAAFPWPEGWSPPAAPQLGVCPRGPGKYQPQY